jgi:uncharacterized protein (TIGR02996 family)
VFNTDTELVGQPTRRTLQHTAKRIAFRALTSGQLASQLVHASRSAYERQILGAWLIANPTGTVTAHQGQYIGQGGPWDLADAIIPGSRDAVQSPALNGFYRERPDAFAEQVARHKTSRESLLRGHDEAIRAGHCYAAMQIHTDPAFIGLLRAAIGDRGTQLVFHDWLAEHGFPHADELRSIRWNQGKWTEKQLLDLLSKPFDCKRRSFTGQSV